MHIARHNSLQALTSGLLCLCLFVQTFVVPLHLSIEDHIFGHAAADSCVPEHGYSHGLGHPHAHGHGHYHFSAENTDEDSHPPHPAEEHLCKQQQIGTPPPPDNAPRMAAEQQSPEASPREPIDLCSLIAPQAPLRPPPRASARPRAPPAVA